MTHKTLVAGGAGLLLAGLAFAIPAADIDFSRLTVEPATANGRIAATTITLGEAVEVAEKATDGRVESARYNFNVDPAQIELDIYTVTEHIMVQVDATSGEIAGRETIPTVALPGAAVTGNALETDSGLMYHDLVVGEGASPEATSTVLVHYTGWLVDGTKFDSSVDRGDPIKFPLDGVIAGWTEGVAGMKVGGKRKLIIPYDLAYGPGGRGPIPPKAMLIFDVELLEIIK